jgi:hypothetical protein
MRFQKFSVGLAAATLTLSLSSAWAQDERGRPRESEPAPSRPSNGENVGSAVPRGGGGSETASSSSSSSSTSPSPSNNSPANVGGSPTSWMDPGSSAAVSRRAPVRPARADRLDAADQRRGNGGQSTGQAVPRSDSGNTASGSPNSTNSSSGSASQPAQGHSREVPPNSRPRDGRNQTGTAVERRGPPPSSGDGHYGYGNPAYGYYPSYAYDPYYSLYYSPYYNGYGYWNPYGYGYGLGYFSYDPFLFGAMAYPGYYAGGGGGYAGSGGYAESSGGGSYVPHYQGAGSLRLKIKPAEAKVYIDGYYVGMVDSFDGVFQKLNVDAGPHKVELRANGYQTTEFDVVVTPGDTVTYKGDMKRH